MLSLFPSFSFRSPRVRETERERTITFARETFGNLFARLRRKRADETEREVNKRGQGQGGEGGEGKSEPDELYAVEVASLSNGCDLISRGNLASYSLIVR